MDYNRQMEEIARYLKKGEKKREDFKLGIEFEHFVVDKDTLKTISYYGKDGVAETLKDLENKGWKSVYEEGYILGLKKGKKNITLEPGSQLELSLGTSKEIYEIEKEYLEFLEEIIPILEKKNQGLMAIGYHPETKIDEIKLLPKRRYDYMFDYFKTKGSHAHNMMKGTSALQISMDYDSEEDYRKKFRITNGLAPVFYAIFDNAPYFEGEKWNQHNLRSLIWQNCDNDRSGIVDTALEDKFSYEKYGEYILNTPPIFTIQEGQLFYMGSKLTKEIFNPENYKEEELEHLLTMVFPDVRTKKYIEIRMMDSIPYPLNLSAVALFKGILYDDENLNKVYELVKDLSADDVNTALENLIEYGLKTKLGNKTVLEIGKDLVDLAKSGLSIEEVKYILPLEEMLNNNKAPKDITRDRENLGKKQALDWCLLNNLVEVK